MQNCSEAVVVAHDAKFGRHFVVQRQVVAGETLLEERPLFVAPHWECEQMKCSNCLLNSFVMCKKCQVFPLCIDCNTHSTYDCAFFSAGGAGGGIDKNLLVNNYAIYAVLKLLLLLENPDTKPSCEALIERDYKLSEQSDMTLWQQREELLVTPLLSAGMAAVFTCVKLNSEQVQALGNAIDAHAFEVTSREGDALMVNEEFQMKIYAALALQSGDIIYNCYANPLMGTLPRQQHLRESRCLACDCARCLDPAELGTHMSTMKCHACSAGYADCAINDCGNWVCRECKGITEAGSVHKLIAEVSEAVACTDDGDLQGYEALLAKYASLFHPQHYLIVDMKQQLASILRANHTQSALCQPSSKLLQRRVQLCEELLPVVRAVLPGISKLYAVALYEYLLALRQCSVWAYREQQIDTAGYVSKLQRAREVAAEALGMLQYEPPNSVEGHLAQRIKLEQKHIEQQFDKCSI